MFQGWFCYFALVKKSLDPSKKPQAYFWNLSLLASEILKTKLKFCLSSTLIFSTSFCSAKKIQWNGHKFFCGLGATLLWDTMLEQSLKGPWWRHWNHAQKRHAWEIYGFQELMSHWHLLSKSAKRFDSNGEMYDTCD